MTLQIFWPKPGNPREGGQKGGTNGREGGEGGFRAKPGNQLVMYNINYYIVVVFRKAPFALFTNFPEGGSHCIVTSLSANNNFKLN